jgi:hypothetical protein
VNAAVDDDDGQKTNLDVEGDGNTLYLSKQMVILKLEVQNPTPPAICAAGLFRCDRRSNVGGVV